MTTPLILACVWVLAAAVTAMLPMRRQMVPGIVLLAAAPVIIASIGWVHGPLIGVLGLLAFASMFRNPLIYFARRALGRPAPLPPDLERKP